MQGSRNLLHFVKRNFHHIRREIADIIALPQLLGQVVCSFAHFLQRRAVMVEGYNPVCGGNVKARHSVRCNTFNFTRLKSSNYPINPFLTAISIGLEHWQMRMSRLESLIILDRRGSAGSFSSFAKKPQHMIWPQFD